MSVAPAGSGISLSFSSSSAMSSLLQLLQDVDPTINASIAAELRTALVAINQQAQAEPASASWSLSNWWGWLEEQGYNREAALAVLKSLCSARIGAQALAGLVETCRSAADAPAGLGLLQAELEQLDADLPELLHRLEAASLSEEQELAQLAGGMSKIARNATISLGGGFFIGCIYAIHLEIKTNKQIKLMKEAHLAGLVQAENRDFHQEFDRSEAAFGDAAAVQENSAGEAIAAIAADPQKALLNLAANPDTKFVFADLKDLSAFTPGDIVAKATKICCEDLLLNAGKYVEGEVAAAVIKDPQYVEEYTRQLEKAIEDHPQWEEFEGIDDLLSEVSPAAKAMANKFVQNGEWFKEAMIAIKTGGLEGRLRNAYAKGAYEKAFAQVSADVETAKNAADKAVQVEVSAEEQKFENPAWDALIEGDVSAKVKVKVKAEVTTTEADVKRAARETDEAMKTDVIEFESDL